MRRKMLWIGVAAVVVALSVATVAFAATQRSTTGSARANAATTSIGFRGAMMGGAVTVKNMRALHAEHQADMKAWFDKYGADPSSAAARTALAKLRAEHWNDMRAQLKKYGINAGTTGRGTMMGGSGAGYGGMMGGAGYGSSTGTGTGMMGGY